MLIMPVAGAAVGHRRPVVDGSGTVVPPMERHGVCGIPRHPHVRQPRGLDRSREPSPASRRPGHAGPPVHWRTDPFHGYHSSLSNRHVATLS